MTFADAMAYATSPSGDLTWTIPEGWQQGRGAFGGLTFATLASAAQSKVTLEGATLRALTGEIPAAVLAGKATLRARLLRQGNALATVAAEVEQGGAVVAHVVASFGKTRPVGFERQGLHADLPPYDRAQPIDVRPFGPTFAQFFEYRPVQGVPYTGAAEAEVTGWVKMRDPGAVAAPLALVAMADVWYPSVLPVLTDVRPFGTIAFSVHLFERGWRPGEPLFHRSRLIGAQDGYMVEVRELFTAKGELAAFNQQTLAIIK